MQLSTIRRTQKPMRFQSASSAAHLQTGSSMQLPTRIDPRTDAERTAGESLARAMAERLEELQRRGAWVVRHQSSPTKSQGR
jgi:hypothetical protein